jgi:hypothetical protein
MKNCSEVKFKSSEPFSELLSDEILLRLTSISSEDESNKYSVSSSGIVLTDNAQREENNILPFN